jgi:hypothetical protein
MKILDEKIYKKNLNGFEKLNQRKEKGFIRTINFSFKPKPN